MMGTGDRNGKMVTALKLSLGQMPGKLQSRPIPKETQRGAVSSPGMGPPHTDTGTISHCLAPQRGRSPMRLRLYHLLSGPVAVLEGAVSETPALGEGEGGLIMGFLHRTPKILGMKTYLML